MEIKLKHIYPEVSDIFIGYYHELTGNAGKPKYSNDGSLLHWIAEHKPLFQTEILHICYEQGFKAGYRKARRRKF